MRTAGAADARQIVLTAYIEGLADAGDDCALEVLRAAEAEAGERAPASRREFEGAVTRLVEGIAWQRGGWALALLTRAEEAVADYLRSEHSPRKADGCRERRKRRTWMMKGVRP